MIAPRKPDDASVIYRDLLAENPDAMIVAGLEEAYVGMTATYPILAVYDYDECVCVISRKEQMSDSDAEQFLSDEVIARCLLDASPIFIRSR